MQINRDKFTIYEVEEIYKEFLSELKNAKVMNVNLDGVLKIDMSAIELLVSVLKTCEVESIPFSLSNISPEVKNSLKISGFNHIFGVNDE